MAGTGALRLGPAARRLISPDRWTDGYPGPVAYSRELDVLLDWASKRNYLKRFVPNIEAKNTKRDEALNELRLAYLFDHTGFPVVQLDPPGAKNKNGEYLLDSPEKANVFVELKSRGWESELSKEEIAAGRQHQPKYRNQVEGGAVGNWDPVQRCIEQTRHTRSSPKPAEPAHHRGRPEGAAALLAHPRPGCAVRSRTAVSRGRVLQLQPLREHWRPRHLRLVLVGCRSGVRVHHLPESARPPGD